MGFALPFGLGVLTGILATLVARVLAGPADIRDLDDDDDDLEEDQRCPSLAEQKFLGGSSQTLRCELCAEHTGPHYGRYRLGWDMEAFSGRTIPLMGDTWWHQNPKGKSASAENLEPAENGGTIAGDVSGKHQP